MQTNNSNGKDSIVQIVRMSEIKPCRMFWIWKPYIPMRKLTILRGDPGCGKTSFALQLAAIFSRGDIFPGQVKEDICSENGHFQGGDVLFISAEDDLDDSIVPRLIAANADLDGVLSVDDSKFCGSLSFTDPKFEALIKASNARLVIIDPIQAFIGAGVDGHRANEVRPVMSHLRYLARQYACAIVLIEHLNKNMGGKAIYRGLGSIDITAAARSILMLGSNEKDPTQKGVAHIKSNVGQLGNVIGFNITDDGFKWDLDSTITKEAILGISSASNGENGQSTLDKACEFLQEVLKEDARTARDITIMAQQFNISKTTLQRAREKLGVETIRKGFGKGSEYLWSLKEA